MDKNNNTRSSTRVLKRRRQRKDPPGEIPHDVVDKLFDLCGGPDDVAGENGLLKRLTSALVSKALEGEMASHLGYARGEDPREDTTNRRNGHRPKTLRTSRGRSAILVPRDRESTFEPKIVPKNDRTFEGFDDQILSLYGRGMSTRDIENHIKEMYGVDVSPDLVSRVTDSIKDELDEWRSRPLEPVYPIVYIDAIVAKTREKGCVQNRPIYLVVGVDLDGHKDVLGMWMQGTEGAKYWLAVLAELKQRGLKDIFILCADGLKGLPEAVEAAFPNTIFQTCIVHLIRSSTRFVSYKDRKYICGRLRELYTAPSSEIALQTLVELENELAESYPTVLRAWREREAEWTPFLEYPAEIRRVVYTTNTIEALNRFVRKSLKTRGHLPSDDAAMKLVYLAAKHAKKTWGRTTRDWGRAIAQFAILFEGRVPLE